MPNTELQTDFPDRLLKIGQVRQITGWSHTTIYNRMNAGLFPRAIKLVDGRSGCVRWSERAVMTWIRERHSAAQEAAA